MLNTCIEFTAPGVASLSMDERLTIANMTTEWGALAGVFPFDDTTRTYLLHRAEVMRERGDANLRLTPARIASLEADMPRADADAVYSKEITFDLSAVTPFVAGPNEVKTIVPLPELEAQRVKIDKAYLLSCVNGRREDLAQAASALRGKRVAAGVKLYVAAASSEVEDDTRARGDWDALLKAGATALPPGCGPCIGLGDGVLADASMRVRGHTKPCYNVLEFDGDDVRIFRRFPFGERQLMASFALFETSRGHREPPVQTTGGAEPR